MTIRQDGRGQPEDEQADSNRSADLSSGRAERRQQSSPGHNARSRRSTMLIAVTLICASLALIVILTAYR